MSTIQAHSFLTLHYRLSGPSGEVVSTFGASPATLTLGSSELSPALEALLIGLNEGETHVFELPAGAAYGERQADMQQWVAKTLLAQLGDPHEVYSEGDVVQFPTPDGLSSYAGVAREVQDTRVLFDFNHPLAGQPVRFEVQVIGVL